MQVDPLGFYRLVPVRDRFQADLLGIEGVTGVDVGLKEVGGVQQPTPAILVFVRRKGEYRAGQEIPPTIAGVPTDVIEAEFKLQGPPSGVATAPAALSIDNTRYDPCQGGACIAPARIQDWYGSLGMLVTDASSAAPLWLSAYHVLCVDSSWDQHDRRVLQPAAHQDGTEPEDMIGEVVRGRYGPIDREWDVPLYVDAAVCDVSGRQASPNIVDLGQPRGARGAVLNGIVVKYGATTRRTEGKVVSTDFTVDIEGEIFNHQYRVERVLDGDGPLSMRGDSGAAVLDSERFAVGLVIAGDDVRYSIVNPIEQITEALGITVPASLR